MATKAEKFNMEQIKPGRDEIRPGDTVKVYQKIKVSGGKDKNKEKIQIFEGLVLARKHGKGVNATITVRKVIGGVGVEKIFPIHSPIFEKIEIVKRGKVRRSKLYYLRTAKGRKSRLKRAEFTPTAEPEHTLAEPEPTAEPEPKPESEQPAEPAESPAEPEPTAASEPKPESE